ncbi:MAG: cytochrome c3 family protein [Alphaproteobacteria bacterium]|nr:cytochrome c3 family protein [Alphaproteobacteria bacterium]
MAFVLRTVTTSAEGREIVRTRRVEGDRLTIGRGPACDIHLTDLAVALRHAEVARSGERLAVTVENGLTVALDGRQVGAGSLALATGGDLRIGSHLLRFLPVAAGSDEVAVGVERVTEGEAKLDRDAERLFSLASVLPGKRPLAWLLALLVIGLCIAWPVKTFYDRQQRAERFARFQADELWSAGHLSAAHASLRHDCNACHVKPFESVRDAACASCHRDIHGHADPFRLARAQPDLSAWGRFQLRLKQAFDLPPGRCIDCHTEHQGPQQMAPTPQRFCADCHGDLAARLPDTRLGNAGDFARIHPDFRPAVVTGWQGERPILTRVSGPAAREANGLKFPHALHLSRSGGAAQMARRLGIGASLDCADCHRPEPNGARYQPVVMERDCAQCHSLAFARTGGVVRTLRHGDPAQVIAEVGDYYRFRTAPRPPSLAPAGRRQPGAAPAVATRIRFDAGARAPGPEAAVRAVFSPGGACYDCHQVDAPPAGSLAYRIHPVAFPERYIRHGWFDHRPHAAQSCGSCHQAARSNAASDLLIPGIATCRGCHGGERTAKPVASPCAMCHSYHARPGAPAMVVRQRLRGEQRPVPAAAVREGG